MSDSPTPALPFEIRARCTGSDLITLFAQHGGEDIATERYHVGTGKRRREVAEKWAADVRLVGRVKTKQGPKLISAIEHELEASELRAVQTVDIQREAAIAAAESEPLGAGESDDKPPRKSQATALVELVLACEGVTLWHTPDGDGYATIQVGEHIENWPIRSRRFRQWASRLYLEANQKVPGGQATQDAVTTLEGVAVHKGEEHRVYVRLAERGGVLYLDLCNAEWEAVEVKGDGWEVIQNPPVKFRRARGMLPLPVPAAGGDINTLRRFVNVRDDGAFILIVAWLIGTFHPRGPYAILEVDGEQGSAKTTLCRMLRRLVDPNEADLRTQPRDERDLVIAARNGHVLGFDNLSGLPGWLSDGLSRIATGTGFGTRELYSNDEEVIFSGARPIVCNGIGGVATRSDLLDRTIRVDLPSIPESDRKPESDLWRKFDAARPGLLGAILDPVATALNRISAVRLNRLPRMADFATWIVAAEPSLPWKPGAFLDAYAGNRKAANESALEASPVAGVLRIWFDKLGGVPWSGTASELLTALSASASEAVKNQKGWPHSGRSLSGALRRIAPNLRAVGIDVGFDDREAHTGKRLIHVERVGNPSSPPSPPSPDQLALPGNGFLGDDEGDDVASPDEFASPVASPENGLGAIENAVGDDGDTGDGVLPTCSNDDGDDSDRLEREAIMAVEAEAERAWGGRGWQNG